MNSKRSVFSECTEVIATSLTLLLHTILPEKCAFVICTVWTKMRSLASSLADGVLADPL